MIERLTAIAVLAAVLMAASPVGVSHEATERYIPIGKSPGVSGKTSYRGVVESRNDAQHSVRMRAADGAESIRIDERTQIYLDRTSQGKTNLRGTYADCQPGREIEVKYIDNDPSKPAQWIKIRMTD